MIDRKEPLYEYNGTNIYQQDIINTLHYLGVTKKDVLFVHSDVSVFGHLKTFDREYLFSSIVEAFKEVIGENGILMMPTFSYSFCKNEIFDLRNTRSTVGALTEYFRTMKDVSRSVHPIFSVAIWGKNKEHYLDISKDSFGDNSIFAKLHQNNGKIVIFGSPFITSCTFIHYIEQKHGIPYRYFKTFTGITKDDHGETPDKCTYFVRYLDRNVNLNTKRLEQDLIENGLLREKKLGNGKVMVIRAVDFFDEGNKLLDKDITYFLDDSYRGVNNQ